MISSALLTSVRCPDCTGSVAPEGGRFRCAGCGRTFSGESGALDLRPRDAAAEQTKYLDDALHVDRRHESIAPPLLGSKVRNDMLRSFLALSPADRAIDLGCGSGRTLVWNTDAGAALAGIDIAPFFAQEAIARCDLVMGDLRRLPLRSGAFTKAWSLDVLEHLSRPALVEMLGEANRVLADGGGLFVYTHVRKNGWVAIGTRAVNSFARACERIGLIDLRQERLRKSDHVNPLADHDDLERVAAQTGFAIERITYYTPVVGAFIENVLVRIAERAMTRARGPCDRGPDARHRGASRSRCRHQDRARFRQSARPRRRRDVPDAARAFHAHATGSVVVRQDSVRAFLCASEKIPGRTDAGNLMALVIVRRFLGVAMGVALGLPLVAAWHEPAIPLRLKLGATTLLAIAAASPAAGLCLIAGLLPMAFPLRVFARTDMNGGAIGELLVLGFLSGAIVHLSFRRPVLNRLLAPAVVLGTLAAASGIVLLSAAQASFISLSGYLAETWQHYVFGYFADSHDFGDLHLAVTWLEALGLGVVAESVARRHPRAGRLAVQFAIVGAAVLAYFSARRLVEVSLRSPEPFAMAWRVIRSIRFNPFYTDINAAGSLYALFVVPAISLAAFGRQRLMWPVAGLIALACWLAGSRAAVAGVAVGVGVAWILSRPRSRKYSWWGPAAVAAIALAVLIPTMLQRGSASVGDAMEIRREMMRVSLRMTAVEPVFGVGLGRFRTASPAFMTPELEARYGRLWIGENAHNNFLQLLAELGPAALVAFVWMLAAAIRRSAGPPGEAIPTAAHAGLVGGVVAFTVSALAGHPFLTDHIRLSFFLALGLAAGLQASAEPLAATSSRWRTIRVVTVALVVAIVAVTLPSRVRARRDWVNLDAVVVGASAESEGPEGVIYRVAEREASWFVPAAATAVEVPVRTDPASRAPCTVRFEMDGRAADVVTAPADAWRLVPVPLGASASRRSRRLVLYSSEGCRLMVGRFVVHH